MCYKLLLLRCPLNIGVVRNISNFNTYKIDSESNKCVLRFGCNPTVISPPLLSLNVLQSANFCYSNFYSEISSRFSECDNCLKISHLFCCSYSKKGNLNVGDEVDLIKAVSPVNPDTLTVARVEILSAKPDEEEIYVWFRRFKSLQIENYENALYKVDAKEVKC